MSKRYNLRNGRKLSPKRKREQNDSSIDNLDREETGGKDVLKLQSFLRGMVDTIIEDQLDDQVEATLEMVDEHLDVAFDAKLKETSKKFSKMSMEYMKKAILESCHDMIHDHLDNFDLSLSTDKFKTLISEVIKNDFGIIAKQTKTPRTPTRIKIVKAVQLPGGGLGIPLSQNTTDIEPGVSQFPEKFDEEVLKDNTNETVKKILNLKTSIGNKTVLYREFVKGMNPNGTEKRDAKAKEWLDTALSMPYDNTIEYPITTNDPNTRINSFLLEMKNKLDGTVHGLNDAKEEMLLEVMKRITSSDSNGKILVLEGPPGIGKNLFESNNY